MQFKSVLLSLAIFSAVIVNAVPVPHVDGPIVNGFGSENGEDGSETYGPRGGVAAVEAPITPDVAKNVNVNLQPGIAILPNLAGGDYESEIQGPDQTIEPEEYRGTFFDSP